MSTSADAASAGYASYLRVLYVPIAATISETCTHPIDFVKTQTQIRKTGILTCARETFAKGGVLGFYPSLPPAVGRHWIYTTCRINIYEKLSDGQYVNRMYAALLAGTVAQFIANPMDFVKIQVINNPQLKVRDVFSNTWKSCGFTGFYIGWLPNVTRSCLVNTSELLTYDYSKNFLVNTYGFQDSTLTHTIAATLSGIASTLTSTPADFVKSNYISDYAKYNNSVVKCIAVSIKERGILVLWKGSLLNWIRLGPWQTIFWVSYEWLKKL
jgi:solute carrier family 25 uncoupling protein 27